MTRYPQIPTSWDNIADWYSGWASPEGSNFHQQLAIPTILKLLKLKKDEKVLDIGCGTGALAPHIVKMGGQYIGLDASRRLIEIAKKKHGKIGQFIQGDATKLGSIKTINPPYDSVVFLLSIQDMDPLSIILKSVSRVLKNGGKLIIFMTHPAFRIPRQSGWGQDKGRGLIYRRVDRYLTPAGIPLQKKLGRKTFTNISFHRPLQQYINQMSKNNLLVNQFLELPTYKINLPHSYSKTELKAHQEFPLFLALRALKQP